MTEKNDKPKLELVVNNDKPDFKKDPKNSTADKPILKAIENDNNRYAGKGMVKLIRLITGEVIMGFYKPNGDYSVKVSDPVLVHAMAGPNGQMQLGMMPYMAFSKDESFEFSLVNILNVANPADGLRQQYIQSMTGLILPEQGGGLVL